MLSFAFAIALVLSAATTSAQTTLQPLWTSTFSDEGPVDASLDHEVHDSTGNTILGGEINGDYAIRKVGPDGVPLWTVTIDGPAGLADELASFAVDASGNVFAVGGVIGWYITAGGTLKWTQRTKAGASVVFPRLASFDSLGNPVLLGVSNNSLIHQRLDPATGLAAYSKTLAKTYSTGTCLSNGDFAIIDSDGSASRVRARDGAEVWRSSSTISTDRTYVLSGNNMKLAVVHVKQGAPITTLVRLVNSGTGATVNEASISGNHNGGREASLAPDGTLYLVTYLPSSTEPSGFSQSLHAMDALSKGLKWSKSVSTESLPYPRVYGSPTVASNSTGAQVVMSVGDYRPETQALFRFSRSGAAGPTTFTSAPEDYVNSHWSNDNTLFTFGNHGNRNGTFSAAFDVSTGSQLRRLETPSIGETPQYPSDAIALQDGRTPVGSASRLGATVTMLDPSGRVIWSRLAGSNGRERIDWSFGSRWSPVQVIAGTQILVVSNLQTGNMHLLEVATGKPISSSWSHLNGIGILPNEMFVLANSDGDAIAIGADAKDRSKLRYTRFSLSDLSVKWSYTSTFAARGLASCTRISPDLVAMGGSNGTCLLNLHSGRILWTDSTRPCFSIGYSKTGGLIGAYYLDGRAMATKFSLNTGASVWTIALPDSVAVVRVVEDRLITLSGTTARSFLTQDGKAAWIHDFGTGAFPSEITSYVLGYGLLGISSQAGMKFAKISIASGEILANLEVPHKPDSEWHGTGYGRTGFLPCFVNYPDGTVGAWSDLAVKGANGELRRVYVARFGPQ